MGGGGEQCLVSEMPCRGGRVLGRHHAEEFQELFSGKVLLGEQTEIIDGAHGFRKRSSILKNKVLKFPEALCTWHSNEVLVPCL